MTDAQRAALAQLCKDYHVQFDARAYTPAFDLPDGWVNGWVGPIYVGVSPEGNIHS